MCDRKEYMKNYQRNNKNKIKIIQQRYYENNKAEITKKASNKSIINSINRLIYNIEIGEIDETEKNNIIKLLSNATKRESEMSNIDEFKASID
jgi:hypothetical protein